MQLVSREETEQHIIEEYIDGKNTIRNYTLKPVKEIKQESKKKM